MISTVGAAQQLGDKLSTARKNMLIFLAVGALIIGIYLYGRKAGKDSAGVTSNKLPDSGKGIPKGWAPAPIVKQVYDSLTWKSTNASDKQAAYKILLSLTNDQLVAVYNEFNRMYRKSNSDDTMYGWLDSKINVGTLLSPWAAVLQDNYRPQILERMQKLGLYAKGEI